MVTHVAPPGLAARGPAARRPRLGAHGGQLAARPVPAGVPRLPGAAPSRRGARQVRGAARGGVPGRPYSRGLSEARAELRDVATLDVIDAAVADLAEPRRPGSPSYDVAVGLVEEALRGQAVRREVVAAQHGPAQLQGTIGAA